MKVGIATDSSCDLSDEDIAGLNVEIVPLFIRFGPQEFVDREEISVNDFYQRMADSEDLPQTATPPPGRFVEAFQRHLDAGCDAIVCVNLSSKMSATMQAATQASSELDADIRVVDSRSVSAGLGNMVLDAARLAADGADADRIVAAVKDASDRTRVLGTLNTLENLKRGGRIGGAQAMLGSLMSIKPIVDLSSGEVKEAGRQRTRKKALRWLCNQAKEAGPLEHLTVIEGNAEDAEDFRAMLAAATGNDDIRVAAIGPVVGAHAGAGVIGTAYQIPSRG